MLRGKILNFFVAHIRTITIEPVIFLTIIGASIVYGASINTNLLMWKICRLELNYSQEICANLSAAENNDVQKEVQGLVNNFQMISQWISSVPTIAFSIVAGALSDRFGRKPLIMFPLIGNCFRMVFHLINYSFIETLPLEFFYLDDIASFFGGFSVYYLGIYSYGSTITHPRERAHRLARLDGVETLGTVLGTVLSPIIFDSLGYYGNFSISLTFFCSAAIYLFYLVSEPIEKKNVSITGDVDSPSNFLSNLFRKIKSLFAILVLTPLVEMKSVILKARKPSLRFLIFVQLFCYALYIFCYQVYLLLYLYMILVFDGLKAADFAHMTIVMSLLSAFSLTVIMPIFSGQFQIHDALMMVVVLTCEGASAIISPFAKTLWQFYLAQALGSIYYCKFALVRSLLSKCVGPDELGKFFSILAVAAAISPIAGNPAFRQLYNKTIGTFPGAVFLLTGSITLVTALFNFFLYLNRSKMTSEQNVSVKKDEETTKF